MNRFSRVLVAASLVTLAPALTGCDNFDMDKFDIFGLNEKKKLPGDRKPLFPEGVPGVTQGVPPEYLKQNVEAQAAAEKQAALDATAAAEKAKTEPKAEEKPKAEPKRRAVARTPSQIRVQSRAQDNQAAPAAPGGASPWPSSAPPQTPGSQAAWPAPRTDTFSR
jgi:hypothetical protein